MKNIVSGLLMLAMLLSIPAETSAEELYALYGGGTLTFYYDNLKSSRPHQGEAYSVESSYAENNLPRWHQWRSSIQTVKFDMSMAYAQVTSTACWFYELSKLTTVNGLENLKTGKVTDMNRMFCNCSSLVSLNLNGFDTSSVTDMSSMFAGCGVLKTLNISSFDTKRVSNFFCMFYQCSQLSNLSMDFDTSSATNMAFMFYECKSLSSINLRSFKTLKATTMKAMFYQCNKVGSLDLSGFNTSNVTDMSFMFAGCNVLKQIDVSAFKTQKVVSMECMFYDCRAVTQLDLGKFNTSSVTNMKMMFNHCESLKSVNLSSFDTSKVTDMSMMFVGCLSLPSVNLSNFNTSNVTTMVGMFWDCKSLTSVNMSRFDTQQVKSTASMFYYCSSLGTLELSSFDTSSVEDMSFMFAQCEKLKTIYVSDSWTTANVTEGNNMFLGDVNLVGGRGTRYDANHVNKLWARIDGGMRIPGYLTAMTNQPYAVLDKSTLTFYFGDYKQAGTGITYLVEDEYTQDHLPEWCAKKEQISKVVFDPSFSSVRLRSTAYLFYHCYVLSNIEGLEFLHTDEVTTMEAMFEDTGLYSLDLSHFNTSKVVNMECMFAACYRMETIDLSSFNTRNVENMSLMFYSMSKLKSLDVSHFDTSKVTDMYCMFSSCDSLKYLNLSGLNTGNVKNMRGMFKSCVELEELDLRSFNTYNVTNMKEMFLNCLKLRQIFIGGSWTTENVKDGTDMFLNCNLLVGEKGTFYKGKKYAGLSYARLDGRNGVSGYLSRYPLEATTKEGVKMRFRIIDDQKMTCQAGIGLSSGSNYYKCSVIPADYVGAITIPDIVGNYSVVRVAVGAFSDCKGLTSVNMSENMEEMADYAFENCLGMKSITIPENVTTVSNKAFTGCDNLKTIYLNSSKLVRVERSAGSSMEGMFGSQVNEYVLGEKVTYIGNYAFHGCKNLKTVTFPSGLYHVGNYAYSNCSSLSAVNMGKNLYEIGYQTFSSCPSLTSLTLPDYVTIIGDNAFDERCKIYVNKATLTLFTLWNADYRQPYETGSGESLLRPYLDIETTQTTMKVKVMQIYPFCTYQLKDRYDGTIYGMEETLREMYPGQYKYFELVVELKGSGVNYHHDGIVTCKIHTEAQTKGIDPVITLVNRTASSIEIRGKYTHGDAQVVSEELRINNVKDVNHIKLTGLDPGTSCQAYYYVHVRWGKGEERTYYADSKYSSLNLVMKTLAPKIISAGNAIVAAEANVDEVEQNAGFEWRRTDWSDDFASNTGKAIVFEGEMEGCIYNLNTDKLWKFRPYYLSNKGTYYYGDWMGLDPTDASYFKPTIHTYATVVTEGSTALVQGMVLQGTDNVKVQGFKYWKDSSRSNMSSLEAYSAAVPSNAKTVEAQGQVMTATLKGLAYGTDYSYVAFVTTTNGETYYGETRTFTSAPDPAGMEEITMDDAPGNNSAPHGVFDLRGVRMADTLEEVRGRLPRGIYIVNGRKMIIK